MVEAVTIIRAFLFTSRILRIKVMLSRISGIVEMNIFNFGKFIC